MSQSIATCYYPDGTSATGHTPCNRGSDQSWCCAPNDYCLDFKHCLQAIDNTAIAIGRGSCTDKSWRDSQCPQECSDVTPSFDTILYLTPTGASGTYCCAEPYNSSSDSCPTGTKSSTKPFDMSSARIVYNRTNGLTMDSGSLVLPVGSDISVVTATATATVTANANAITQVESSSNATAIAAGIAVPLSVLLVTSLAINWFLARKLRSQRDAGLSRSEHITFHPVDTAFKSAAEPQYKYQVEAYSRPARTNEVSAEREVVEIGSR